MEELKKDLMSRFSLWKQEIGKHKNLIIISILFFILANIVNHLAGTYVDKMADAATSDLILDHLPTIDFTFIFVYGYILVLAVFFIYPLLFKVKKLHSVIGQFSLLVLIRSFFIILTHLRAPLDAVRGNLPFFYKIFSFSNDMFFSGHVALCFMGFLLFRKEKVGIFFLIASFVVSFTVLAMHIHYSIDVFAAFFITYGSYKLGGWFFNKINRYDDA